VQPPIKRPAEPSGDVATQEQRNQTASSNERHWRNRSSRRSASSLSASNNIIGGDSATLPYLRPLRVTAQSDVQHILLSVKILAVISQTTKTAASLFRQVLGQVAESTAARRCLAEGSATFFLNCAGDISASSDGLGSSRSLWPDSVMPVCVFNGSLPCNRFSERKTSPGSVGCRLRTEKRQERSCQN